VTRAPGELLRDVAKALACFASTKHAQAHYQKNPAIKAEMLEEVSRIEALEREVRAAAQAQAGVKSLTTAQESLPVEITWDAAVARLMQGGNLVLMARGDRWDVAQLLRDAAEKIEGGVREFHDESCQEGLWFRTALAQAQAGAGERQGEGA